MITEVLLVRHPETTANAARRFMGGNRDEPYTARGEAQKAMLAEAIRAFGPQVVLTSPLRRAAEVAAEAVGVLARPLEELREIDFGAAEGLTYSEAVKGGVPVDYLGGPEDEPVAPGGETWEHFTERVGRAARMAEAFERVAIVSHGGVVRALLLQWLRLEPRAAWDFAIPTASAVRLVVADGRGTMTYLGPAETLPTE